MMWPFKWNLFSRTFSWYYLYLSILQNKWGFVLNFNFRHYWEWKGQGDDKAFLFLMPYFIISERKGLARLDSRNLEPSRPKSNPIMKPRPPSSPMLSLSSSQGRSNPFRVGSPNKKASGKSFFDSVEEEKKSLLMNKNKICEFTSNRKGLFY